MQAQESRACRSRTDGMSHNGPWRACKKIGEATCPRSTGCSRMYSAPASRAARSSETVRSTRRFACASSRLCCAGTSGRPVMCSRSRTGGGPPSGTLPSKNPVTEKVEQGGEATTAAKVPEEQRSSKREYTESRRRSCFVPPPCSG
eukprot:6212899-Pleurochrysis_carterae.AAC.1